MILWRFRDQMARLYRTDGNPLVGDVAWDGHICPSGSVGVLRWQDGTRWPIGAVLEGRASRGDGPMGPSYFVGDIAPRLAFRLAVCADASHADPGRCLAGGFSVAERHERQSAMLLTAMDGEAEESWPQETQETQKEDLYILRFLSFLRPSLIGDFSNSLRCPRH